MAGTTMIRARGRTVRREAGRMNKLEAAYDAHLFVRSVAGEVAWYAFDRIKLRLADRTYYEPDFLVVLADGTIQVHEVKGGFWEDDARVKIKVAAEQFPVWGFMAVTALPKKLGGGWKFEEF